MDLGAVNLPGQSITNASASLAENFETFLTLLTEQMKNQDPLNPLDSTEFVTQLVQFSQVEQQINQNENLETMIGLQYASAFGSTASYLGRMATVDGDTAQLAGGEARWDYKLASAAESATLVVTDQTGRVVLEQPAETSAGSHQFAWDGTDSAGQPLPDGPYALSVLALDAEGETIDSSISVTGRVTGADFTGSEPALLLGDIRVPLGSVKELREAPPPETQEPPAA